MQSKRSRIFIVFAIVLIMAMTTGVAVALKNQTPSSTTGQMTLGSPYIPIAPQLQGSMPSFTANDVRKAVHSYGFPLNPSVKDDRITSISFITAAQASLNMNKESVGLPANALVCYVEFSGPIPLVNQSLPYGATMYTAKTGHMVIDASNGYLLVVGGI
jgi:hypothetical protein